MGLLEEINYHLISDKEPSKFFQSLNDPFFKATYPFTMLSGLKAIKQSPQHHPEGSVWNHTLLVIDEAAARKSQATDSRVFMWAALLHDIGKAETTKVRKGKITCYDHDKVGAGMAREFLREYENESFISGVAALIRWHMQILHVTKNMRFAEIEAMKKDTDVRDVALLGLCDRFGRMSVDRQAEEKVIHEFLRNAEYSNGK